MLTTGDICKRLGLTISAGFIENTLRVPVREKNKAANYWHDSDFVLIRDALARHIAALPAGEIAEVDPLFG